MKLSIVILTYNEEKNIRRTLESTTGFDKIIIVDSFSKDITKEIVNQFQNVELHERVFDNHTNQWNFGLDKCQTNWVLSIDADYIITDALREEIFNLDLDDPTYSGFNIPFKYCVDGKPLRGTILPPRLALFDKRQSRYIQDGHTQLMKTEGKVGSLKNHFLHDDRKPLSRWLWAQERYADLEVNKLLKNNGKLSFADKLRKKKFLAPIVIFFYCYIFKLGILDGKRGLYYAFQRVYAELIVSLKLIEQSFEQDDKTKII